MKKELFVNGRFLSQPRTGVERYSYEMCRALHNIGVGFTIICPKNCVIRKEYDITGMNIIRYGIGSSHLWEQLILPIFFIGKHDYLIISFMGLGSILLPNKVMTIHDLSFLYNKSWFSSKYYYYYRWMTPLAARTSRHIITVSNFSKKEILKYYGFLSAKDISVIYNAAEQMNDGSRVAESEGWSHSSLPSDQSNYLLAVSSIDPRKNFKMLLKVFKGLDNCVLKIVGAGHKVFAHVSHHVCDNQSETPNIEWMGRVDDDELIRLYRNARAFIFPSLYEGFGLPLIEAMSLDCPVLVSDIEVFHEVCGNAAIYFNPNSADDIEIKIKEVLSMDDIERREMIKKGRRNAMRFSWESSANKLKNILESVYE